MGWFWWFTASFANKSCKVSLSFPLMKPSTAPNSNLWDLRRGHRGDAARGGVFVLGLGFRVLVVWLDLSPAAKRRKRGRGFCGSPVRRKLAGGADRPMRREREREFRASVVALSLGPWFMG